MGSIVVLIRFQIQLILGLLFIWTTACQNAPSASNPNNQTEDHKISCSPDTEVLEAQMNAILEAANTEYEFTYQMERADGRIFTYRRGSSTEDTVYESASTSKMVTGLIIMRLVEKGILSLSDRPQDYISNWPIAPSDSLYQMTLEHLLSFRSGLTNEPFCINLPTAQFEDCVISVANLNANNGIVPGTEFYYSGTHLQVAGLMAIKALGKNSWQEVFADFQKETGAFPQGRYDLPSAQNPRLAGGMHWTGREYLSFLRSLKEGKLLSTATMTEYLKDRTALPVAIVKSPSQDGLGEEWHYGLGYWHECHNQTFNCIAAERISSPGAYGAYPYWDLKYNFIGMLSIQTSLGGFRTGISEVERMVESTAKTWATCE